MDDLSRAEYPAMLAHLPPGQAVHALHDRFKRISKVNTEVADWLQERRKVEEQYVQGLRRLTQFRVPNAQSELGSFQAQWDKILMSADAVALSHHQFATKIETDVEIPLRNFNQKKEMLNMQTIQGNIQNMAKELEDAQDKSDKLTRKGGKASAQKVDMATGRLESASQTWESQAPFIFETLQALDESRMNQLRDCLTQYGTFEGEQAQRHQTEAETVLNSLLDYNTASEIQHFVAKTTAGRPKIEKRTPTTRGSSSLSGANSLPPPPSIHASTTPDDRSDHSVSKEGPPENKLRSRIGTMLGRRRQSIHGGFGQLSPSKGPFGRATKSSHGPSPRASSSNLNDSSNRLGSLAEDPNTLGELTRMSEARERSIHEGTNGIGHDGSNDMAPLAPTTTTTSQVNGAPIPQDIADVPPPPGPPPSQRDPEKDAEGFNVPTSSNDPISQAQREAAAHEAEQLFKLSIQKEPVAEEDPEEKKAALSNVAQSLSTMGPARRTGTIRGRRDVRNTIYVPAPVSEGSATTENTFPPLHATSTKPPGMTTLASEASVTGTSDTQSIRSANSLSSVIHAKHPDMHEPGLNSSIMETVSATFEHGEVKAVKVNGEIAFSYNTSDIFNSPSHLPIRINNFPALEVIGPNRICVTHDTPEHPEQFNLDLLHMQKTTIAFSYRLHVASEASAAEHVPILLHPVWKPQGDKLGLLLQYKLNPAFKFASAGSGVQLHNLVLFAKYDGRSSGAQTKPAGTHLKDKHFVYWRLGDVALAPGADWQKIVCRIVGEQGAEPKAGVVEARWEFSPPSGTSTEGGSGHGHAISVSKLEESKGKEIELSDDDPFADSAAAPEGRWVEMPSFRNLVSGKYEAR
ncbi:Muniscin C-terminal mu homology domain-containing protein [Whalleya microplaca]|nr:Muniscin C-terminal mu homology domain-containing protein [Whalleya microplaca]